MKIFQTILRGDKKLKKKVNVTFNKSKNFSCSFKFYKCIVFILKIKVTNIY